MGNKINTRSQFNKINNQVQCIQLLYNRVDLLNVMIYVRIVYGVIIAIQFLLHAVCAILTFLYVVVLDSLAIGFYNILDGKARLWTGNILRLSQTRKGGNNRFC